MLVLSRNLDSEVHIGAGIVVKVLSVRHRQVKLGIEAPNDVHIWRGEIAPDRAAIQKVTPVLESVRDVKHE